MESKLKQMITGIAAMAVMIAMFASCSKEAETPATSLTHIKFVIPATATIKNLDLLAFDANGLLAGRWQQCTDRATISLGEGRYTFIACSGVGKDLVMSPETMTVGQTPISGITVSPCTRTTANPYVGVLADVRVNSDSKEQNLTIKLLQGSGDMAFGIGLLEWGNISGNNVEM